MTLGFPGGSAGKESSCNAGDLGSIPGLGRSPGEGNGHPLQYSGLENPMDCISNISEVLLTVQITHLGDRRPMRCKESGLDIHMEKK